MRQTACQAVQQKTLLNSEIMFFTMACHEKPRTFNLVRGFRLLKSSGIINNQKDLCG